MEDDDAPRGRLLSRREALALMGAAGAWVLTGCTHEEMSDATRGGSQATAETTGRCVVRPEQTEGPYFVDEQLLRSDLRSDPATGELRPGIPVELEFQVSRIAGNSCTALAGAVVDLWHCDALGVYSDVRDPRGDTTGQKFLRGYQTTDAEGIARFTTIYPGWYRGRAVHIHFKIRSTPAGDSGHEFTSQLYFDDALTDQVHAREPYAGNGARDRRNSDDDIFRSGGSQLLLATRPTSDGFAARFSVALQTS